MHSGVRRGHAACSQSRGQRVHGGAQKQGHVQVALAAAPVQLPFPAGQRRSLCFRPPCCSRGESFSFVSCATHCSFGRQLHCAAFWIGALGHRCVSLLTEHVNEAARHRSNLLLVSSLLVHWSRDCCCEYEEIVTAMSRCIVTQCRSEKEMSSLVAPMESRTTFLTWSALRWTVRLRARAEFAD